MFYAEVARCNYVMPRIIKKESCNVARTIGLIRELQTQSSQ